jgi:acyl carrier protein
MSDLQTTDRRTADQRTNDLDDGIREVLAAAFGLEAAAIPDTTSSQDVADWDSLGHVGLIFALEQRFGVVIGVEHIAGMQSLARIREVLGELGG